VNGVSINNDVLSDILLTSKTVVVRWGWLVDGPVVVWWVGNWVLDLGELDTLGLLLLELNFIWANDDLHVEMGVVHGVAHEGWDNVDWDSLGLGKSNSNWCWLVGDEVLEVSSGDVGVHELEKSIGIGLLGKGNGNWCWLVGDEVLEVSSGDVGIHELEETISIGLLGKSDGDWGWLIGKKVLKVSSGDVGIHKFEEAISVGLLGKSDSDWGWLIGDKVLQVSSGDVGIHELEEAIGIRFLGKSNGDWCWLVGNEVLEVSSGDVGVHKLEETIGIGLLGKSDGDWGWLISEKVLEVSSGDVGVHELEEAIGIGLLGKSDSDWSWLVGKEVLKVSSGDVGVHELEETISIGLLGKGDGDWGWLIGDKVLKVSSGDVGIHKFEETIGIGFLGKSNSDWCWLVGDEVLQVSSGDVGVHKLEKSIGIGFLGVDLDEGLSDWGIGVLDEVNESRLGHVLTVKLTNLSLSLMVLLGPVGGLVINGVVSIIIWETFIHDFGEGFTSSENVVGGGGSGGLWNSLDHNGKSNVVVVGDILLLISGSVKDGVESVITNNLSERLEGNGLNNVLRVGWVHLEGDGLNLIDWDIGGLSESIEWIRLDLNEVGLGWDSGDTDWGGLNKLLVVVMLVVLLGVLL